ncbi:MAG: DUF1810 domain-containing protein [Candidatus Sericytochromatia bacterium]
MSNKYNLERFLSAQEQSFDIALKEIKNGKKVSHWMWYIFPQIQGLGFSEISKYYSIRNLEEAKLYLKHNVLGSRLIEISEMLLTIEGKTANNIFGYPDDLKLKSSMTLFKYISPDNSIFHKILDKYFNKEDEYKTLEIINKLT